MGSIVRKLVPVVGLSGDENCMIEQPLVLSRYQRVTDRQTDGQKTDVRGGFWPIGGFGLDAMTGKAYVPHSEI